MNFFKSSHFIFKAVVLITVFATLIQAFEDDALPFEEDFSLSSDSGSEFAMSLSEASNERSLISKMIERGKILLKSLPGTGKKLAGNAWSFVPTPKTIFNLGKQTLIGLPQEIIAYAVNSVCSAAIHFEAIKPSITPSVHLMNFQFLTQNEENVKIPLLEPHVLWRNPHFNKDWNTTFLVTGWNSNINSTNAAIETLFNAYKGQNVNFVAFDTAHFIDSLYAWSAFNTEGVGKIIGAALTEISKVVEVDKIHLIGHSLGAHICGFAGRHFTELTGKTIPRITGLDPARPCFNEGERLNGLQRGDAQFVDIIHSNAGILGIKDSKGDVDFYPNGKHSLQPGCWTIICAHSRSYEYFAESVSERSAGNFMATQCNSLSSFRNGKCKLKSVPMGIDTPSTARGNFYLETNKKAPYGRRLNSEKYIDEESSA